ncbi:hypothetical protein KUCAC02_025596 [Chaenocephalus aceratus]|uniref:Uncharacterized protein n=1 Tax=Chaenocephalus aceratus TaxID=36190 RepID=A0ACB9VVJ2_CHAAC|nr:hypothetical protein KUCAC02_025596 [Chaenocephalus aceratus]
MSVQLRVIVEEHDIRKINLPSGIPNSINNLISIITDTFQLNGEFALLYEDKDFGNQFFSVISSADLYDKATVKLVRKEPLITLNMLPVESGPSSAQVLCTSSVDIFPGDTSEADPIPVDDSEADTSLASTSSQGSMTLMAGQLFKVSALATAVFASSGFYLYDRQLNLDDLTVIRFGRAAATVS